MSARIALAAAILMAVTYAALGQGILNAGGTGSFQGSNLIMNAGGTALFMNHTGTSMVQK